MSRLGLSLSKMGFTWPQSALRRSSASRGKATFALLFYRKYAMVLCFPLMATREEKVRMVEQGAPARRRRLGAHGMIFQRRRVFARLREGLTYEEIAGRGRRERLMDPAD